MESDMRMRRAARAFFEVFFKAPTLGRDCGGGELRGDGKAMMHK